MGGWGCPRAGTRPRCPGRALPALPCPAPPRCPAWPPASQPGPCPQTMGQAAPHPRRKVLPARRLSWEVTTPKNTPEPEQNLGREGGEMPALGGGTYPKIHHHLGSRVLRGSAGCSPTLAALGAAPPRQGRSPGAHCPAPAPGAGTLGALRSPPSRHGAATRRRPPTFRAGCRCLTCCRWAGWRAALGRTGQPRVHSRAGAYSPQRKNGRGRDKAEILSGVFKSKGKGECAGGADLLPSWSTRGVRGQAGPGGISGSGCAPGSVGSAAWAPR